MAMATADSVVELFSANVLLWRAMEAITCGYLSIVLMAGLTAIRLPGWWWLDSVAALALIPFILKEGGEAVRGECGCCRDTRE